MEYALWVLVWPPLRRQKKRVLILVIVEYALWEWSKNTDTRQLWTVLILVIVEYALWVHFISLKGWFMIRLNPCYSGICSVREFNRYQLGTKGCLNPCYSGICSVRGNKGYYPFWFVGCLNPCYSGICSVRPKTHNHGNILRVLILVIVEYALWGLTMPLTTVRDSGS